MGLGIDRYLEQILIEHDEVNIFPRFDRTNFVFGEQYMCAPKGIKMCGAPNTPLSEIVSKVTYKAPLNIRVRVLPVLIPGA
jgi:hypothetical protein